jgi:glutathione S-transferase
MAMKLYGSANDKSFNTLKIRFALAELGIAYEFVPVDLAKGESRTPDFTRINPHGKVPVLVDDDFALPESDAILWYLAEKDPGAKLLPRFDASVETTRARAQILRFCDLASTAFYPAYSEWWNATNNSDPAKRSPEAADTALVKVKRGLDVLEKTLAAGEHLVGEFSLADVTNVSILFSLKRRLGMDPMVGHERVKGWYERVTARPAWESVAE